MKRTIIARAYSNLPADQQSTQRLADQFNEDERAWERRLRLLKRISRCLRVQEKT